MMTTGTTTLWSGWMPDARLAETRAKVERMARRAERRGFPAPVLTVGEASERRVHLYSQDTLARFLPGHDLTVSAAGQLRFDGWALVAVIEPVVAEDGERLTLVRKLPDSPEVPTEYRAAAPDWCDHCRTRRDRRRSFVVVRDGDWRQVGSTCLRDFLGHSAAELIAWLWFVDDLAVGEDGSSGAECELTTDDVLALACRVTVAYGWVSKAKAAPPVTVATSERVAAIVGWRPGAGTDPSRELAARLDDMAGAAARAERLRDATVAALEAIVPGDSDWAWSLSVLWRARRVTPRQLGLFVSAVVLGLRAEERSSVSARVSLPLGTVGERLRGLRAEVLAARPVGDEWFPRTMVKLRADDHDLLWWASRFVDADPGDTIVLDATVKAHETDRYTGGPVTVLTRGTILEVARKEHQ